jgi:hypothetical protein
MGQHGGAGWWPMIFAMLTVFCSYSGVLKKTISGPKLRNNSTQVYFYLTFFTSTTDTMPVKAPPPNMANAIPQP